MQFRKFTVPGMREGLAAIKKELGPDAVVLATRRVKGPNLFSPAWLEVTAAIEERPQGLAGQRHAERRSSLEVILPSVGPDLDAPLETLESISDHIPEAVAPSLRASSLYDFLVGRDVESGHALRLVRSVAATLPGGRASAEGLAPPAVELAALARELGSRLGEPRYLPKGRPDVIALVGPTGVGKTTTIAKLAATAALIERRRVALITLDTYRVGAVEQIQRFAILMGVPCEVAHDEPTLRAALDEHADADLILIDTAGRNPRDTNQIPSLSRMFSGGQISVHLCLAATTRQQELHAILKRYQPLNPQALLFTKLDEADVLGAVVNGKLGTGLPLSWLTYGQQVPEDLIRADGNILARALVGRSPWAAAGELGATGIDPDHHADEALGATS